MHIYIYIYNIRFKDRRWDLRLGIFKFEQLSDLDSQVWTAVRLGVPGHTDPRSKIFKKLLLDPGLKDFQFFLGSWIQIRNFSPGPGPKKSFWNILDLGSGYG